MKFLAQFLLSLIFSAAVTKAAPEKLHDLDDGKITCIKCDPSERCDSKLSSVPDDDTVVKCDECGVKIVDKLIQKGCAEEIKIEDEQIYYTCNSNNCNNIQILQCYKCSGKDCLLNQSDDKLQYCENYDAKDKCYSEKTNATYARRGCISDKPQPKLNEDADTCSGSKCNNKNYTSPPKPSKKVNCYTCNSKKDINCVKITNTTKIEQCETSTCITRFDNERYTVRGCKSDNLKCHKDDSGEKCIDCVFDKCNHESLEENQLKCYHCEGKDCLKIKDSQLQPCQKYDKKDACFVDVINNTYALRGCLSDGQKLSENAYQCQLDSCNNDDAIKEVECVQCKDTNDGECFRPQKDEISKDCTISIKNTCKIEVLFHHKKNQQCFTLLKDNIITRGCDKHLYSTNSSTTQCNNDNLCNNKCKPLQCYTCDSKTDPNCKDNFTKMTTSDCNQSSCYSCVNKENSIFRGCGKNDDSTMTCKSCSINNCNTVVPPPPQPHLKCYICNSKDNANCAQVTDLKTLPKTECTDKNSKCFVKIVDRDTIRGCTSENKPNECTNDDKNCKTCKFNLCNKIIYPENRLKCHMCQGTKECVEEQDKTKTIPCQYYNATDSCYAYSNSNNDKMYRGCYSDVDDLNSCMKNPKKCKICHENGCNSYPLLSKPTLTCIKCEKSDKSCAWGQINGKQIKCAKNFYYYLDETCYTRHFETIDQVQRGCTLDDDNICSQNCTLCKENLCNKNNVVTQSCIQCDNTKTDDLGKKCAKDAKNIKPRECEGIMGYNERGCYTKRDGKKVIRGCAANLKNELENCRNEKDKHKCEICMDDGCNTKSEANTIFVTISTILFSVIVYILK